MAFIHLRYNNNAFYVCVFSQHLNKQYQGFKLNMNTLFIEVLFLSELELKSIFQEYVIVMYV